MCGILAVFGLPADDGKCQAERNRQLVAKQSALLRHRGPDASRIWQSGDGTVLMSHERLIVVDASDNGRRVA